MKFTLEINMDNAAFQDNQNELSEILRNLSTKVEGNDLENCSGFMILDSNGNKVGAWEVTE